MTLKKEIIISGIVGIIIGIFLSPILFNIWGWSPMMGGNYNNRSGGMMGSSVTSNIDRHFIAQMIPHHEGAIEMAKLAQERSSRPEIKTLADNIIQSQTEEIEKMKKWYKTWYGTAVPENSNSGMGMGRGMMRGGMMGGETDIEALKNAPDFDKSFIEEMIPHHQMALMMVNMLLQGTEREEMKTLGQAMIDAQSREIDQMRSWYRSWYEQ
ncbi:MAG: DUF305 domain-containing protein [Patescibacteria group bacterium]